MHIVLLLVVYSTRITGNIFIITTVIFYHHLHTPMYFFLMNSAMKDIGLVSIIVPKSVFNTLMNIWIISYSGCVAQITFFFFFFLACDICLLPLAAYDRCITICDPLYCEMIMNRKACTKMISVTRTGSLLNALLHTIFTFMTPFCSNIINQFYCEVPYLLKIACLGLYISQTGVLIFRATLIFGCFIFVLVTYVQVFSAVLRIPLVQGRKKAFTTCLPHLIVFCIFFITGSFAYLKPISDIHPPQLHNYYMYSVIPSMMNPFIYSMRKKDIRVALSVFFWSDVISV